MGVLWAVAERDPTVKAQVERELPGVLLLEDEQDVCRSDVEAVVIATPASTHARIAKEVLLARKHVLVEKPFTLTVADAEEVIAVAREVKRLVMVGHILLYQPAILWLRDYLNSGSLGTVSSLYQERLSLGTVREVENALWSLGVHDVAALLFLLGQEPAHTATWGQEITQTNVEDDMHLHMQFRGGIMAHIHNSWLWPETRRRLTIVGSRGMIEYDEATQVVTLHKRRVLEDLGVLDEGSEVLFHGDPDPLGLELSHFLECVQTGKSPRSSGESAVAVIRVLSQADRQIHELRLAT